MIPLSVLDLSPIAEGENASSALRNSLELAQHAERLGYHRYWLAEHHNMPGIASAATSVVIGYVAGGTKTIRVGSGGIMLPNHSPLVIAEQFGTLASLYPGRIDLGLGRAPGTDMTTANALRRDLASTSDRFPTDVQEMQSYFGGSGIAKVRAIPGEGLEIPIWLLGSSLFSAQLAAHLGLPFAFASHFAPDLLFQAVDIYRSRFRPSEQLSQPYVMTGVNVLAADTEEEAHRQFTSIQQAITNLIRGTPGKVPVPIGDIELYWSPAEKAAAQRMLTYSFVGSSRTIGDGLRQFIQLVKPDELIVHTHIHDHAARLRSFQLLAAEFTLK